MGGSIVLFTMVRYLYTRDSACFLQQLNTRQLLLDQSNQDQAAASAGTTDVINRVVRGSVDGGETEAADRSAAITRANQVLGTTKRLATVVVGGGVEEARVL